MLLDRSYGLMNLFKIKLEYILLVTSHSSRNAISKISNVGGKKLQFDLLISVIPTYFQKTLPLVKMLSKVIVCQEKPSDDRPGLI